jgi:hypothetical protein
MIGRLLAALGPRSQARRQLTLAALGLVLLLVVASALAPSPHPAEGPVARLARPTRTRRSATAPGSLQISTGTLVGARRAAAQFVAEYLPLLYGRGSPRSIEAVTPSARLELSHVHGLVTPVERDRHPRVVSLTAVRQAPAAVLATALVADGGVTAYSVRITLRFGRDGWLVSRVDGG